MFTTMKIFLLLLFTVTITISGTTTSQVQYGDNATNPSVYYEDEETLELVKQMPKRMQGYIHTFYKNDHIQNVVIDELATEKKIFTTR